METEVKYNKSGKKVPDAMMNTSLIGERSRSRRENQNRKNLKFGLWGYQRESDKNKSTLWNLPLRGGSDC